MHLFAWQRFAYNLFSTLKAVLASVHGRDCLEQLSYYYLADELEGTYRGMMIALPSEQWRNLQSTSLTQLSSGATRVGSSGQSQSFYCHEAKTQTEKAQTPL